MTPFFILLISSLLLRGVGRPGVTFAQPRAGAADSHRADKYAKRDLALEREALAQRKHIDEMLPLWAKQRLEVVFEGFLKRLLRDRKPTQATQIIKEGLARQFADLSRTQARILAFYVATGVIKIVPPTRREGQAEGDRLKDKKDSLSELSEMDMLMLQQMLDKKNQLETMIANVMKEGFEGGQAAIQSLKPS